MISSPPSCPSTTRHLQPLRTWTITLTVDILTTCQIINSNFPVSPWALASFHKHRLVTLSKMFGELSLLLFQLNSRLLVYRRAANSLLQQRRPMDLPRPRSDSSLLTSKLSYQWIKIAKNTDIWMNYAVLLPIFWNRIFSASVSFLKENAIISFITSHYSFPLPIILFILILYNGTKKRA